MKYDSALRSEEQIIPIQSISCKLKVVSCPSKRVSISPFIGLCFETVEKSEPYNLIFSALGDTCKDLGNNNMMLSTLNFYVMYPLWIS